MKILLSKDENIEMAEYALKELLNEDKDRSWLYKQTDVDDLELDLLVDIYIRED